jgi:hypothetical protein
VWNESIIQRNRNMARKSSRRSSRGNDDDDDNENENVEPEQPQGRSVAAHVRDRQRAVAEREAARLARPEQRRTMTLKHADRKKSAVSSTPFGLHKSSKADDDAPQEWCGPWSVARQMIAEREELKRKREQEELEQDESHPLDALMNEVDMEQKRKAHPSMTWKGELPASTPSSIYAKRQKRADVQRGQRRVPTLFQICVNFVVANFEYVESLGDVDNDVRVAISKELVDRNQLDAKAFSALVEPTMETLEVVDCAGIPQDIMADTLSKLTGLRYLLLTHAGRCFGIKSVQALLTPPQAPLCCLSIAGGYLLLDEDAAKLIDAHAGTLQSLTFSTCPLLGEKCATAIQNTRNLLELSLEEMPFSEETLKLLASSKEAFATVKSLSLKSLPGLTDDMVSDMLQATGASLETLDLSHNFDLTDACLSGIRQCNAGSLRSLTLTGVKELTAAGLETFFTHPLEGLPPPPKLKVLHLASCDYQAVTDKVLQLVTASASTNYEDATSASTATATATASTTTYTSRGGGLAQLDIQGSTLVTDIMLEQLVETSANTLTDLNVSFCPLITDQGLGYLVSKAGRQLSRLHVWGCAQVTDDFFDGHARVDDRSLEIVGAWVKKSGTRSLR